MHQKKSKRNNTNSKIKSKARYDKTMNVKVSDIKVGDEILVKQQKQNKLTTLYKSEPFSDTDAHVNECVRNVADVHLGMA